MRREREETFPDPSFVEKSPLSDSGPDTERNITCCPRFLEEMWVGVKTFSCTLHLYVRLVFQGTTPAPGGPCRKEYVSSLSLNRSPEWRVETGPVRETRTADAMSVDPLGPVSELEKSGVCGLVIFSHYSDVYTENKIKRYVR